MEVFGRERKFFMSVGATCEISKSCPDGDINKLKQGMEDGSYADSVELMARIISALNKGYEIKTAMEAKTAGSPYKAEWLTIDECLALDKETFNALTDEAMDALVRGAKRSVEAQPKPRKKTAEESGSGSMRPGSSITDSAS